MSAQSPFEKPLLNKKTPHDSEREALTAAGLEDTEILDINDIKVENEPDLIDDEQLSRILHDKEAQMIIAEVLKTLTPKEEMIVRMYFGIGTNTESMTMKEIGKAMHVTTNRISQILAKVIRKLKHWSRVDLLLPLVDGMDKEKDSYMSSYVARQKEEQKQRRKKLEDAVEERLKHISSYQEKLAHIDRLIVTQRQIVEERYKVWEAKSAWPRMYSQDFYLQLLEKIRGRLEQEKSFLPDESKYPALESDTLPETSNEGGAGGVVRDVPESIFSQQDTFILPSVPARDDSPKNEERERKLKMAEEKREEFRKRKEEIRKEKEKKKKEREAKEAVVKESTDRFENELRELPTLEKKLEHINKLIELQEWNVRKNRSTKVPLPLSGLYASDPILKYLSILRDGLKEMNLPEEK